MQRNKEMEQKKQVKLQEQADRVETEISKICTGVPTNNKTARNEKLRSTEQYYLDQLKSVENKKKKVENLRKQLLKNEEPMKNKPEINKVSLNA